MTYTRKEKERHMLVAKRFLMEANLEVKEHIEYVEMKAPSGVSYWVESDAQPFTFDLTYPDGDMKTCKVLVAMRHSTGRDNSYRVTRPYLGNKMPDFFLIYIPDLKFFAEVEGDFFETIVMRDDMGRPIIVGGKVQYKKKIGNTRNIPADVIRQIKSIPNRSVWE